MAMQILRGENCFVSYPGLFGFCNVGNVGCDDLIAVGFGMCGLMLAFVV